MQLPDFIKRMLGFADKVESHFTAAQELAKAQVRIKDVESIVSLHELTIAELRGQLEKAQAASGEQAVKITNLTADLEKEKGKANAVIAAQGLTAEQVPPSDASALAAGHGAESPWAKYHRLLREDPRAAGRFYAEQAAAIYASRPK